MTVVTCGIEKLLHKNAEMRNVFQRNTDCFLINCAQNGNDCAVGLKRYTFFNISFAVFVLILVSTKPCFYTLSPAINAVLPCNGCLVVMQRMLGCCATKYWLLNNGALIAMQRSIRCAAGKYQMPCDWCLITSRYRLVVFSFVRNYQKDRGLCFTVFMWQKRLPIAPIYIPVIPVFSRACEFVWKERQENVKITVAFSYVYLAFGVTLKLC